MGKKWKQWQTLFSWTPKSLQIVPHEIKRRLLLGKNAMTNLGSILKSRHQFADKVKALPYSQSYGFSSSQVWMWELDHKESWAPKNWCFWIVVLEKTLESPLDCKIKLVNPKRNQSWIFIGRIGAEAERKWKSKVLSHVRLLATPWTTAYQALLSMGYSRQEYWSGLPLPSPIALTR